MVDDMDLRSIVEPREIFSVSIKLFEDTSIERIRRKMRMTTLSKLIKFSLHIYGVWPYLPSTILFRLYWIVAFSTAQVFQYRYVIMNTNIDDFSQFMDGVSSAMTSSLMFIKLIILWSNQRIFFNLMQMMTADWQNCTSSYSNLHVMTKAADVARLTSRCIVGMQVVSVISYSAGVLAMNANSPEELEPDARALILTMNFPFNISTDFNYAVISVIQFYHLALVGFGITIVNSLLVTLIFHVGGQIDILREWLMKAFSDNSALLKDEITMRSLIIKHQRIILFSENIENLYTYIALMVVLSDTLIICCLGYIMAISIGTPNAATILVKSLMYYMSMNLEVFIYCFSGEYLSAKSRMVGNAAYDSVWYDNKKSNFISFIIVRSQKILKLTSGKIMDLSLERFTSVVKASASYMSVLLAMY